MGRSGMRAAYGTGRGKITLRAETSIEEIKKIYIEDGVKTLPLNGSQKIFPQQKTKITKGSKDARKFCDSFYQNV